MYRLSAHRGGEVHFSFGENGQKKTPSALEGVEGMGRRPTLPRVTAVPSAQAGLTSLFGMGRGEPRCYNHPSLSATARRRRKADRPAKRQALREESVSQPVPSRGIGTRAALPFSATASKYRVISTARLCRCRLYTCGLSTSSSMTALE